MNLHEYQAKFLLGEFGVPVPLGRMVRSVEEANAAAAELGGDRWVVKAQVHAGGRGKAGGVKLVESLAELESESARLLGSRLVTGQSAPDGLPVNCLLVEQPSDIQNELYLGLLVDRAKEKVSFIGSVAGGMDIEAVAAETPDKIITVAVEPAVGLQAFQCRYMAFHLGLAGGQLKQLTKVMTDLYRLFLECDASLVEINPLVLTGEGELIAIDGKINLDSNALYRQKSLLEMRDPSQEDDKEYQASAHGLNYIALDGNIACMVNGAGLAMATMDLIKLHGGEPANFLDVGGGTTPERVAAAFKLILSDSKVEAILVNIFGGIVRCDLIAEGIIQAVQEVGSSVPVVVRLEGTNVEQGKAKLKASGLAIIAADNLTDAAIRAVAATKRTH